MSIYQDLNHSEAQNLADILSVCRPDIGSKVKVFAGKYQGLVGSVFWHGRDRFSDAFRYGDSFARSILETQGRDGYRVGIKNEHGESFFVSADSVIVSVAA